MLIGNKSDLASRRAVTTKEGEQVRLPGSGPGLPACLCCLGRQECHGCTGSFDTALAMKTPDALGRGNGREWRGGVGVTGASFAEKPLGHSSEEVLLVYSILS